MKIFFALLITVILVISGYHFTFRRFRLPVLTRRFYLTGIEFLLLGVILGPQVFNIIDKQTTAELAPLTILLLGWVGLLFGVQFEISKLKRIPGIFFLSAGVESILTATAVSVGMWYTLPCLVVLPDKLKLPIILVMASTAAATAQTGLALRKPGTYLKNRKTITLLRYVASINGLTAILLLGAAFFVRNSAAPLQLSPLRDTINNSLVPLLTFTGILFLYLLFLVKRKQENELSLVVIGMTIFTSGTAMILNFSPLFANFFIGVCLVNMTRDKERIFRLLVSVEKPIYLLLLVFLGCKLQLSGIWMAAAAALYFLYRTAGKLVGGYLLTLIHRKKQTFPPLLGLGLLEQGGLPLAVCYDFYKGFSSEISGQLISVIILSILINDSLHPALLGRILKKAES